MPCSPSFQPWSPQRTTIVLSARPSAVELVEHAADLGVDVADAGVVAVDQLAGLLVGDVAPSPGCPSSPQFAPVVRAYSGAPTGWRVVLGERDVFGVVQVPVLLRGDERQVRLEEADGQEERLLASFNSPRSSIASVGDRAVGQVVVRARRGPRRAARGCWSTVAADRDPPLRTSLAQPLAARPARGAVARAHPAAQWGTLQDSGSSSPPW